MDASSQAALQSDILDLVTTDMDFEQAYSMYTTLQQKNAVLAVEQLQKVQSLNQQYINMFNGNLGLSSAMLAGLPPNLNQFEFHRSQILEGEPKQQQQDDELDKFFSNTESNALEKFLDNLATNNTNPLEFYGSNNYYQRDLDMFDLHTMKPTKKDASAHAILKKELTEAFSHPPLKSLTKYDAPEPIPSQLPTPMDSRQLSCQEDFTYKRPFDEDHSDSSSSSSPTNKKRKSSVKPLLLLEQKRLNHSNSEQRRRQFCKLAYERCLRLITNVDDYEKELVLVNALSQGKKKSKRKQLNKDGLPNLSKHTALLRISGEIIRIRNRNEGLKKLLASQ